LLQGPYRLMSLKKIKITVHDLELGMYVSELDRPWLESPFLFQGFIIETEEVLQQLKETCEFVFIDVEESEPVVRERLQTISSQQNELEMTATEMELVSDDSTELDFHEQLRQAKLIYDRTRGYIDQALNDARIGNSIDTKQARVLVKEMAENIARSPNAMVWLTHLKNRDEYTSIHCMNVCILALSFGRFVGLEKNDLELLGLGALLHDLGKMYVPDEILNKPGKLTEAEFEIIKRHPVDGHKLLSTKDDMPQLSLDIVLHHHERTDGAGYPAGLKNSQIHQLIKMASIVDVYDAITSDRCYHEGMSPYEGLKNMYNWTEGNFDPELIQEFIKCLGIYPIGSIVELNQGQIGVVVGINEHTKLKPVILLVMDKDKQYLKMRKLINLASPKWETEGHVLRVSRILPASEYDIDIKAIIERETNTAS